MSEFALRLARIAASVICSIKPAPKVGVGIRKMTLSFRTCRLEVLLPDLAALAALRVPGDHEERVHAAVAGAVGVELEPRLPDRAVRP